VLCVLRDRIAVLRFALSQPRSRCFRAGVSCEGRVRAEGPRLRLRAPLGHPGAPSSVPCTLTSPLLISFSPLQLDVTLTASASASAFPAAPEGLRGVSHVVAVASCKGGVGKSTVAVNLAYTLAMMGAKVARVTLSGTSHAHRSPTRSAAPQGIFDADVYGPSLPTMTSPDPAVLEARILTHLTQLSASLRSEFRALHPQMDAATRALTPCVYEGVKLLSFGFTGQGAAIMRGPMVSGLISQLVTTTHWGDLDYLILDLPPGTGDIHLSLCQLLPISAAVVVTTPQKLAQVDVVKGVRMFARLRVPTVALVQNMSFFALPPAGGAPPENVRPFGPGCGQEIAAQFGIPNRFELPIDQALSAAGDSGVPFVVSAPASALAQRFGELGASVVQEISKLARAKQAFSATFDPHAKSIVVRLSSGRVLRLAPDYVRRNDCSARSLDDWARLPTDSVLQLLPSDLSPLDMGLLGNYALQINWSDGFNQVAPLEQLEALADAAAAAGCEGGGGLGAVAAARWPPARGE